MIWNHMITSTFMMQHPSTASLLMHDKTDQWVERNAHTGIDISLTDVQPNIHQEIM